MRIRLIAVGRLKDGPERAMVDDYLARARKTGQGLGYRSLEEIEVEAGGGKEAEGVRLLSRASGATLVRLDERGEAWPSAALSRRLMAWRDQAEDVCFLIGGADGTSAEVAERSRWTLGFGVQTWPHRLVRVMLAEQIYRALSIEAGSPYHRE
ncbi:MAG: 23S rRNA (pseudouridine(1915)-N(3))-methyltransferase RlmH [Alphaproteobacteria bacterium]|nr:23S rRNA (pseudouridine(1915)-N(3))-methyltransferase RlmH [Alphaproteobacteria bacterium]